MHDDKIRLAVLARYLGVSSQTARRWAALGHYPNSSGRTEIEPVNIFLARIAHNFDTQPTWESLSHGWLQLCDSRAAASELGITFQQMKDMLAGGRVQAAYLKLPSGGYRFCVASLRRLRESAPPVVDARVAARYMGYLGVEHCMHASGIELARPIVGKRGGGVYITLDSLRHYLRTHLPPWVGVGQWMEECDATDEPLMWMNDVQSFFPGHSATIHKMLNERQAFYIARPNGNGYTAMVLPAWLYDQLGWDRQLWPKQLAVILGVSTNVVHHWRTQGRIQCFVSGHQHDRADRYLWPSCWLGFMREHSSVDLQPLLPLLLHRALTSGVEEFVSLGKFATYVGWPRSRVQYLVESGRLPVLRTPGLHARISLTWVRQNEELLVKPSC